MQAKDEEIEYLNLLKTSTKSTYDSVGSVYCPVLAEDIVFNSIGFRHLIIKPDGTYRNTREAIYKLTLFPLAIPAIKNATAVVDERDVRVSIGRGQRRKYKNAKTYAIDAHVGRKSPIMVKVIILRIGDGNFNFYSIMKN